MGEIKSTLDLVMEKTRHLSMTPKEKAVQQSAAVKKKLHGLLVKYRDGTIKKDRFRQDLETLRANDALFDDGMLRKAILSRVGLNPDDSQIWLDLLKTAAGVDPAPLAAVILGYQAAIEEETAKWFQKIRATLQDTYHVTGSAVVPYLEADSGWNRQRAKIQVEYGRRLEKAKSAGY